jgi:ADP-ribose pyrophosphatase YjhB (NUDIX family)
VVFSSARLKAPPLIREFGIAKPDVNYVLRPGAYGVIRNHAGLVAVVLTPSGAYLPGGGQEAGEPLEATLIREVREECGLTVRALNFVGVADELVFSQEEQQHFRKRCVFFKSVVQHGGKTQGTEPDHRLTWLAPHEAVLQVVHESHKWAVQTACTNK